MSAKVEGTDISRSFLIIDSTYASEMVIQNQNGQRLLTRSNKVTPEVSIEEELSEHENEQDPSHRCVLENKSSYLQARRSIETRDPDLWNLASVGLHKREKETEVVKKMKHVILEFDTRQSKQELDIV